MKRLLLQAIHFFGLSGIGWVLDFCTFTLLGLVSSNLILNNTISSWVGVTFVFCVATRYVFKNSNHLHLKYIIYIVYQVLLIYMISKLLNAINIVLAGYFTNSRLIAVLPIIAKIIVTPITMILNFIVMKGIVKRKF